MAKDKVKKGFFFYFGFFLLLIIAAVLVIFVVMLFMPGTSILGLEYFTNPGSKGVIRVEQTTDESGKAIDFSSSDFNRIEINAGYSEVIVQNNYDFEKGGIYIDNQSKGFVTSKKATDFVYDVTIENGVLKINVQEQNGFLYFSKKSTIYLQVSDKNSSPFKEKSIKITTKDGDVNIGGVEKAGLSNQTLIKNLEVETTKGSINLSGLCPSILDNLSLKTVSGNINIARGEIESKIISISTSSGSITAQKLISSEPIALKTESGKVKISEINSSLYGLFTDAYVEIGTIKRGVDLSNSPFSSSVIKIGNVEDGSVVALNGRDTDFEIGKVEKGKTQIETTTGSITVSEGLISGSKLKTSSGNIKAGVSEYASNVILQTEKGEIDATLPSEFSSASVINQTGKTNVSMPENGRYTLKFYYYGSLESEADLKNFKFDNVKLNRELQVANPLVINNEAYDTRTLILKCNKEINFNWTK